MILEDQNEFLFLFFETVFGLRTGQTGRANTHISKLLTMLVPVIESLSDEARRRAIPLIDAMLSSKEKDDVVALADLLQYELPVVLQESDVPATLLNPDIIKVLRSIDPKINQPDFFDTVIATLDKLRDAFPAACGLGNYHASTLLDQGRSAHARRLLDADVQRRRDTPSGTYLMSLVSAHDGHLPEAVALMETAYANSIHLRNGFVQLACTMASSSGWANALELGRRDLVLGRLTPRWQLQLSQLEARNNNIETAKRLVDAAYREDPDLIDGYATIGWILAETGETGDVLNLFDEDRDRRRLSPAGMLLSSKYYVWSRRFEDAERLVEDAYAADPTALAGFDRIAAAALMIDEEAQALTYWRRDCELGRETPQSAARFGFMQRPLWQMGDTRVYVYHVYHTLAFEEILPYLTLLQAHVGNEVIVEVPEHARNDFAARFPAWQISNGAMFNKQPPPTSVPLQNTRLSYQRLVDLFGKDRELRQEDAN